MLFGAGADAAANAYGDYPSKQTTVGISCKDSGGHRRKKYNSGSSRGHGKSKLFLLGILTMTAAFSRSAVMHQDWILPIRPSYSNALFGLQLLDKAKYDSCKERENVTQHSQIKCM